MSDWASVLWWDWGWVPLLVVVLASASVLVKVEAWDTVLSS